MQKISRIPNNFNEFSRLIGSQNMYQNHKIYNHLIRQGQVPTVETYKALLKNTLSNPERFKYSMGYLYDMQSILMQPDSETFNLLFEASKPINGVSNYSFNLKVQKEIPGVDLTILRGFLSSLVAFKKFGLVFGLIEQHSLITKDVDLVLSILDECSNDPATSDFIVSDFYYTLSRETKITDSIIKVIIKCLSGSRNFIKSVELLEEFKSSGYDFQQSREDLETLSRCGDEEFQAFVMDLMNH